MQLITILSVQFVLMIVGSLASVLLGVKDKLETLGLAYLLGSGIVTILFLLFHWFFGFHLDRLNFFVSFISASVILFLLILITNKLKVLTQLFIIKKSDFDLSLTTIEKSIIAIIILLVGYGFLENYFWPVTDWDALAFYDFRAIVIAKTGSMMEGIELGYFFQYPPYTSFLHAFGYLFGAERVRIIYSFIFISLILNFFILVRRRQDQLVSLFSILVLTSTPLFFEHSTVAYTNLAFSAYFSLGIIYLWFYHDKGILKDLLIGGLLIGISTWIRSTEPFWLVALFLILLGLMKFKKYYFQSFFSIFFLSFPNRLWRYYLDYLDTISIIKFSSTKTHSMQAVTSFLYSDIGVADLIWRIIEVTYYLISTLSPFFSLIFLLYLIVFINDFKSKVIESLTIFLLIGVVWGGTLIFSFTFDTWDMIGGSIVRMCMIFIPLFIYLIVKDLRYE